MVTGSVAVFGVVELGVVVVVGVVATFFGATGAGLEAAVGLTAFGSAARRAGTLGCTAGVGARVVRGLAATTCFTSRDLVAWTRGRTRTRRWTVGWLACRTTTSVTVGTVRVGTV